MPTYEYACPKCGEFETRQSISDDPLKRCPTCRSKVTKLISAPAFHLKGGGWYTDAYQKKNGEAAPETKPVSADGGSKTESTTKPAKTESTTKPAKTDTPTASSTD